MGGGGGKEGLAWQVDGKPSQKCLVVAQALGVRAQEQCSGCGGLRGNDSQALG